MRKFVPSVLITVSLLVGALAHADPKGDELRQKIREKVKAMRIERIVEALDLDEKGTAAVMPIIDKGMDTFSSVAQDAGEARRALRAQLAADKPDDAQINKLVDQLLADRDASKNAEDQMLHDLRKVLTAAQTAKLVVVLPEINRNLEQRIRRAADRRPQESDDDNP